VIERYRVSTIVHRTGPDPASYTVDHSSVLYLIGPDGRYLAPIRADETGPDMAKAIARYLS
jgi:cytochrome oxidase Cu insertion factor (SCO1/SenC/PrrC family)